MRVLSPVLRAHARRRPLILLIDGHGEGPVTEAILRRGFDVELLMTYGAFEHRPTAPPPDLVVVADTVDCSRLRAASTAHDRWNSPVLLLGHGAPISFNPTQWAVLRALVDGGSVREIAATTYLNMGTVERSITELIALLETGHNRVSIIREAYAIGLVPASEAEDAAAEAGLGVR